MPEPNIEDPLTQRFRQDREILEKIVSKTWKNPLNMRPALFLYFSKFYTTIAENTQDERVKKAAEIEAEYFLSKHATCEAEYLMRKEGTWNNY